MVSDSAHKSLLFQVRNLLMHLGNQANTKKPQEPVSPVQDAYEIFPQVTGLLDYTTTDIA